MVYADQPNRRIAFLRRNPAIAIPLLLVLAAGDLWWRLDTTNQHLTVTQFLFYFALVLLMVGVILLVRMHRRSRLGGGR
jgi:hypothetical protein